MEQVTPAPNTCRKQHKQRSVNTAKYFAVLQLDTLLMIRSLPISKGKANDRWEFQLKTRVHTIARLFWSSFKTLKFPYIKHGPKLGLSYGTTITVSPTNFSLGILLNAPIAALHFRAHLTAGAAPGAEPPPPAQVSERGGRGRGSACVSRWVSARALPRGAPPPPRYFSSVETGRF